MINSEETFVIVLEDSTSRGWRTAGRSVMRGDTALRVAADFGANVDLGHDAWRVRVWKGLDADTNLLPVAELTAEQVRKAVANRATGGVPRAGKRLHRSRTRGPAGPVIERVAVGKVEPGMLVLVTDDHRLAASGECAGPLYPAADPDGADAAAVKRVEEIQRGSATVYNLVTSKGTVSGLAPGSSFIPAA